MAGEVWPEQATLRFYQSAIDPEDVGALVYEVTYLQPAFSQDDIQSFIDQEVHVSKYAGGTQLHNVFSGEACALKALSVVAKWQPFDVEDYISRVKQLNVMITELHNDLRIERNRLAKVSSTAHELLRRAEIKAANSLDLQKAQASTITALNHILFNFE